ncbi:MAG: hypothetical protein RIT26_1654 [Pseudomonadota bacterium]
MTMPDPATQPTPPSATEGVLGLSRVGVPLIGLRNRATAPAANTAGAPLAPGHTPAWLAPGQKPANPALALLRVSGTPVRGLEDLVSKVSFYECLNEALGLAHYLSYAIAVVSLDREKHLCGLLLAPTVMEEDLVAVLQVLPKSGWKLAEGDNAWSVEHNLLVSVAQGHVRDNRIEQIRLMSKDQSKATLWNTFLNIIQWGFDNHANDIDFVLRHEEAMSCVAFKIDGLYLYPDRWQLPTRTLMQALGIAYQYGDGGNDPTFNPNIEQQCLIDVELSNQERGRLRWSGMRIDGGCIVTTRLQKLSSVSQIKTLESAGYLPAQIQMFENALNNHGGMLVLSGTVGTGKSLTLSVLMSMLPKDRKIISLEDPVEFLIPNVHQRTVVRDMLSQDDRDFAAAVRALLRSALDGLLFGEVRDVPAGKVVRAVLESGHDIYTTVHARDALGIFARLSSPEINIPLDVLAAPGSVKLCVNQALIPRLCPHCALDHRAAGIDADYLKMFGHLYDVGPEQLLFRNEKGCAKCQSKDLSQFNGYSGRSVAAEMLVPDIELSHCIMNGSRFDQAQWWSRQSDGRIDTLELAGKSTMQVALTKACMGWHDVRDIERRFTSFENLLWQKQHQKAAARQSFRKEAS